MLRKIQDSRCIAADGADVVSTETCCLSPHAQIVD